MTVQPSQRQELGQGRDLVAVSVDPALAQDQPLLAGPGADQMQWSSPCAAVERAAGGLAVDRHHLLDPGGEGCHEPPEASLKRLGVEQAEQAGEGVVTGDAARQAHEATEQRRLGLAEQGHVDARLRARQRRAQRDQQDLQQIVALRVARARIGQIRKARPKPLHTAPPKPFGGQAEQISNPKDSTNF